MGRSRYKVYEPTHPHFITCTVSLVPNVLVGNADERGYVDEASHWRYSSARNYEDKEGLIDVERMW